MPSAVTTQLAVSPQHPYKQTHPARLPLVISLLESEVPPPALPEVPNGPPARHDLKAYFAGIFMTFGSPLMASSMAASSHLRHRFTCSAAPGVRYRIRGKAGLAAVF